MINLENNKEYISKLLISSIEYPIDTLSKTRY